ncbi:hypothetical protein U1Q18_019619 [Sarracenia purpurea var. burkii]
MGKKGSNKKEPILNSGSESSITMREEFRGKRQTSVNAMYMLKLEHIRNLAMWAGGEASILSLGAFFGHRLASLGEALGLSPDSSVFPCQRCESILQPGYNCTVRIEKNTAKVRRRRKRSNISTQNNIVYKCHFCSHRNLKRGTPRGHLKVRVAPKAKPSLKLEPSQSTVLKSVNSDEGAMGNVEVKTVDEVASPAMTTNDHPVMESSSTPSVRTGTTLLDAKRRKRNKSGSKKISESESSSAIRDAERSGSTSHKRKRKSWTSLKEIAESSEGGNKQNLKSFAIPFFI